MAFNNTFQLVLMNFTPSTPIPLISPSPHACAESLQPSTPTERKKISLWKLQCVTVCPMVFPFAHTCLLTNIHCNESLVWYKASDFCYSINIGTTGTPLRYAAVALCYEDTIILVLQDCTIYAVQQFINGVDVRVGPGSGPEKYLSQSSHLFSCSHALQEGIQGTLTTRASSTVMPR